jgi:hypothetical protein
MISSAGQRESRIAVVTTSRMRTEEFDRDDGCSKIRAEKNSIYRK